MEIDSYFEALKNIVILIIGWALSYISQAKQFEKQNKKELAQLDRQRKNNLDDQRRERNRGQLIKYRESLYNYSNFFQQVVRVNYSDIGKQGGLYGELTRIESILSDIPKDLDRSWIRERLVDMRRITQEFISYVATSFGKGEMNVDFYRFQQGFFEIYYKLLDEIDKKLDDTYKIDY